MDIGDEILDLKIVIGGTKIQEINLFKYLSAVIEE